MATIRDSMSNVSHTDQCAIIQELCSLILKAQLFGAPVEQPQGSVHSSKG